MLRILVIIFLVFLSAAVAFFFFVRSFIPSSEAIDHAILVLKENKEIANKIGKVQSTVYMVDEMPKPEADSVEVRLKLYGQKDSVVVEAILIRQEGDWWLKAYILSEL